MIKRSKAPKGAGERISFVLPHDDPTGAVSVVGSFNEWEPGQLPLVKRNNGTRSAAITVKPGTLVAFRYLGEDGHWFDEPDADWIDDQGSYLQT